MMPAPSFSAWAAIEVVSNHLWQSTLFAAAAGLLTLTLRNNRAQVRYWLWLAASVKFLIPFGALVTIGKQLSWRSSPTIAQTEVAFLIDTISLPFSRPALRVTGAASSAMAFSGVSGAVPVMVMAIWFCGCALILAAWWMRWRRVAAAVRQGWPVEGGRELDTLRRVQRSCGLKRPIALISSGTTFEPGVFGIVKPVLLWPRSISERLADAQVESILAHEVSHVKRRDNLAAAIQMLVEAMFWFHPLVWWLEARLLDERERACDGEVLRMGSEPGVYAEGILNVCRFYAESPVMCASGVTGSDLKKRIEAIMNNRVGDTLNMWKKLLLAATAVVALAVPVVIGVLNAPVRAQAQAVAAEGLAFEAASVKQNRSGGPSNRDFAAGGRFTARNTSLRTLIQLAYRIQDFQLSGRQDVLNERFDIVAKAEGNPAVNEMQSMLRTLLRDQFKLTVRSETRELPVYALVMARKDRTTGVDLRRSGAECAPIRVPTNFPNAPPPPPPPGPQAPPGPRADQDPNRFGQGCGGMLTPGLISARKMTMTQLANLFSRFLNRLVIERTGLMGDFDVDLVYTPDQMPTGLGGGPPPVTGPSDGPSIFTALQEQLGLKLESTKGPVDVLVVDRADRPSENP